MQFLIYFMIYGGSALMVYNIIRYGMFVRHSATLEQQSRKNGLLVVPLLLLIFFLIGYLAVGISGIANLLIASILFGGSVFVFLLLTIMFAIIWRIRDTEQVLAVRYEELQADVRALTKDSMTVLRVNLTRDEVEERSGEYLYPSDLEFDRYSDLLEARREHVINRFGEGADPSLFRREGLLKHYQDGHTYASEALLVRRTDGVPTFVLFEATLTKMPVSGDVVAFIIERPYNAEIVRQTLMEKVLMDEYDRIAYLVDGRYRGLISNDGKKENLLLPGEAEDFYESIYLNTILPAMIIDRSRPNPLRLSVIDRALAEREVYTVNADFRIGGEVRSKHFVFYRIDAKAKFYLMLLSDSAVRTEAPEPPAEAETPAPGTAAPEAAPAEPAPEADAPLPGAGLRLLVADDNEINREIAEMLLTAEGYDVELAVNGAEAVEKVSAGAFDAVLMDIQMPVLGGLEATARIRALPDAARAATPVIALTASSDPEGVREALAAGMNGFAAKPLDPAEVRRAIEQALAAPNKDR